MSIVRRFRCAQLSLVSSLLLGGPRALGQPSSAPEQPPLRVLWTSEDPACDGSDVASRALRLVTPGVSPRPLKATVEVRREGPLWVVRLETESGDQTGRRVLRAESCAEIEDALALLLAMTMESRLDPPPEEPAPEPPRPPPQRAPLAPPAPAPAPLAPGPPAPEPDGGPGWFRGGFVRVAGKAGLLQQPGLALGVGAAAGVRLGDVELGVAGTHWPAKAEPIAEYAGARLLIRRENVGLRACWNVWRAGDLVVAPCLAPELTFFYFKSEGLRRTRSGSAATRASLGGSAELRYELFGGALALSLGAGLSWEQAQPFQIEPEVDEAAMEEIDPNAPAPEALKVYNTKEFGPRLEIGVDARF